jgi:hypothetical protein
MEADVGGYKKILQAFYKVQAKSVWAGLVG